MSHLRFVNALSGDVSVDIYINALDAAPLISGLRVGEATCYIQISNTQHQLLVTVAGSKSDIITQEAILAVKKTDYTVIIQGSQAAGQLQAYTDDNKCQKNHKATLRFIHAASTVANSVDLYADSYVIFSKVKYASGGTPAYIPAKATHFTFRVNVAGTHTVVVPTFDVTFKKDHAYTFIVVPSGDGATLLPIANKCH